MDEILKIQRSLSSSDGIPSIMYYNKDRSVMTIITEQKDPGLFADLTEMLDGRDKIYIVFNVGELMAAEDDEDVGYDEVPDPGW